MNSVIVLLLAATATALATGLGAIPVFFLGRRAETLRPLLLGVAAGVMGVASIAGLILPGLDQGSAAFLGHRGAEHDDARGDGRDQSGQQ